MFSQSPGMTVLSWGTGDEGQLGQPTMEKDWLTNSYVETAPKRIDALEGVGVIDVAGGFTHAAAVVASGQVLTWGSYERGKLGMEQLKIDSMYCVKVVWTQDILKVIRSMPCSPYRLVAWTRFRKLRAGNTTLLRFQRMGSCIRGAGEARR